MRARLLLATLLVASSTTWAGARGIALTIDPPEMRADRLVRISGDRPEHLLAEHSPDRGASWRRATIYNSDAIHDWQRSGAKTWNAGAVNGFIAKGSQACLWSHFFDLTMPRDRALLRLKSEKTGEVVLRREVDLRGARDVVVIDGRHFARHAGGSLPSPWRLASGKSIPSG